RLTGFCFGIVPSRDTARGDFGGAVRKLKLGIELPEFFAGLGIDGKDVVVGSREEKFAVDDDGSGFEGRLFVEVVGIVGKGTGVKRPGNFELGDVGFVDLCGGGKAGAASVFTVMSPSGVGLGLGEGESWKEQGRCD